MSYGFLEVGAHQGVQKYCAPLTPQARWFALSPTRQFAKAAHNPSCPKRHITTNTSNEYAI
jgi:hypothetical protein